jgi:Cytosine/adenosine deaminases
MSVIRAADPADLAAADLDPTDLDPSFTEFDHEAHIRRAVELARAAADRGDEPFGSVLVDADTIVAEAKNAVVTDNDVAAHPELTLARRAAADFDRPGELVLYTSTEPCPMCAGGLYHAGVRAIVYATSAERFGELRHGDMICSSPTIFERGSDSVVVAGPVLPAAGDAVHRECW